MSWNVMVGITRGKEFFLFSWVVRLTISSFCFISPSLQGQAELNAECMSLTMSHIPPWPRRMHWNNRICHWRMYLCDIWSRKSLVFLHLCKARACSVCTWSSARHLVSSRMYTSSFKWVWVRLKIFCCRSKRPMLLTGALLVFRTMCNSFIQTFVAAGTLHIWWSILHAQSSEKQFQNWEKLSGRIVGGTLISDAVNLEIWFHVSLLFIHAWEYASRLHLPFQFLISHIYGCRTTWIYG